MTKPYSGKADDRRYAGDEADITYSLKRCIHAEECVHRLATVFDQKKRPWINANGDSAEAITNLVALCPSGALHAERKDGGVEEAIPAENTITLWQDGPLQFRGQLKIEGATVAVESETRATLCRCGASNNKPFCDNAHKTSGFTASIPQPNPAKMTIESTGGELHILVAPNSPLEVTGNMEIVNESGEVIYRGTKTWLCRCGGSSNKPFCDSTHRKNGFQAE